MLDDIKTVRIHRTSTAAKPHSTTSTTLSNNLTAQGLPAGTQSVCVFKLLLPISPGLVMAHAVPLGDTASAILAYATEAAADNAVALINGKYVQQDGLVLMNQKLSARRPASFSVPIETPVLWL